MSLHQTYKNVESEHGRPARIFGFGDHISWKTGVVDPTSQPWMIESARRLEARLHKEPSDCPDIRTVAFTLDGGFRPDIRFVVRAYLMDGRTYWELSMMRHAQLHSPLTRKEKRINKPFRLKNEECRWITRSKAEEAIAHFVSFFLPGYRPFKR